MEIFMFSILCMLHIIHIPLGRRGAHQPLTKLVLREERVEWGESRVGGR